MKEKNITDEGASSQYETVSDYQSVYTDASGSMYNNLAVDGRGNKKRTRKKKRRSSRGSVISSHSSNEGSQSSVSEQVDLAEIAREFVVIMQGGMKLLAATSIGSTRTVTVVTDGVNLTWVSF